MPLINHDINFSTMISQLLSRLHRNGTIRVAWLNACLKGLRLIHDKFLAFTNGKLDEIKYNGQTFVMEKMLDAKFGVGIHITNNVEDIDEFVIGRGSDWSGGIGRGHDFTGGIGVTYSPSPYDFTVSVPSSITFDMTEMEFWVKKYKMFGTTFNIVIV